MKCPSCNDAVPDNSPFCPNCGAIFAPKSRETESRNINLPTDIAEISIFFEKEMEKVTVGGLFSRREKLRRQLTMAFQFVDKDKKTTSFNGEIVLHGEIYQGYYQQYSGTKEWKFLTNLVFQRKEAIHITDFYRDEKGKLWWKLSKPWFVDIVAGYTVRVAPEIRVTPNGGQALYREAVKDLSPT